MHGYEQATLAIDVAALTLLLKVPSQVDTDNFLSRTSTESNLTSSTEVVSVKKDLQMLEGPFV